MLLVQDNFSVVKRINFKYFIQEEVFDRLT